MLKPSSAAAQLPAWKKSAARVRGAPEDCVCGWVGDGGRGRSTRELCALCSVLLRTKTALNSKLLKGKIMETLVDNTRCC